MTKNEASEESRHFRCVQRTPYFYFMKNFVLLLLAVVFSYTSLQCQVAEVYTDTLIEALITTHSKVPISAKSAYKPTIVITSEEIARHTNDDISTLLDRQVGLSVNSALSNPGKDKSLFLQGASGEFTLILLDGVPLTDPSGIGGTFDLRSISLSGLERIEIVKGGQSVLYGSDAIAGVVNLITKGASHDQASGLLKVAYGSYNSQDVSAKVHIPIDQKLDVMISGSRASSDGISEALDIDMNGFDKDGFTKNALQAGLAYSPTERIKVQPFLRFSTFDGDYDGGAFTDGTDTYDTDWLQTGLTSSYSANNFDLNLSFSYNKTDRTFNSAFGIFDFKGRFNNLDLYAKAPLGDRSTIIFGLNHQQLNMIDANSTVVDPDANIFSPYLSLNYRPNQVTNLEGGIRYNRHSNFGSNLNTSFGVSNWLSSKVKATGYFTTSFKAPNLFQLFGQFGANPDLKPQQGRSINIGLTAVDLGLFNEVKIDLFDRTVDDLIIFDFATGYSNIPSQHDQGVELSASLGNGPLRYAISYAYLFGELDDKSGVNEPVENLIRRPKHQFDASISYLYFTKSQVQFNLRYSGNRDDIYFDNNTFLNEAVVLDSYLLADFYMDYVLKTPGLSLFLEVRNLFNTDFQEVAGFSTLGRNYRIGASLSF